MMSKLGAHIVGGPRNGYGAFCKARPAVVLAVNEHGALAEVKTESGGHTFTIFRDATLYKDAPQGLDQATPAMAEEIAETIYPQLKGIWQQHPADFYTVMNEPAGNDLGVIPSYLAFERRMMALAEADGFRLSILNLATGTPDDGRVAGGESNGGIETWKEHMVPHIQHAFARDHVYGRHQYVTLDADFAAARVFQEAQHLRDLGLQGGIVITELGFEAGLVFVGVEPFAPRAKELDVIMRRHGNIIGGCLWTLGKWEDANWQDALPRLTAHVKDNPTPSWQPAISLEDQPLLEGQSPAAVSHVVHLLPQDTMLAEQERLITALHSQRATFAYSADAAHAIAHAGNRDSLVVVWDGERWPDDIFAFLHERGVTIEKRGFEHIAEFGPQAAGAEEKQKPRRIKHTVQLLPQDTTLDEITGLARQLHQNRSTFTFSADAAHALVHHGSKASRAIVWDGHRWSGGDIFAWLRERGVTPERAVLEVAPREFRFTHWPTDIFHINQRFLEDPQNYNPPLVGHDGIDIRAAFGSKVYAVAPGNVIKVRAQAEGHAYGVAVYIQHSGGYRTAYAHFKEALVKVGDWVAGGQPIGLADSTGNVRPKPTPENPTAGCHLHLSLYLEGASAAGITPQPHDLIDPLPFLEPVRGGQWEAPQPPLIAGWAYIPGLELRGNLARVIVAGHINLRVLPSQAEQKIGEVPTGKIVRITGPAANNYVPVEVARHDLRPASPDADEPVSARIEVAVAPVKLELGLHNEDGGDWMRDNGVLGWALHTFALRTSAAPQDMTRFENAGIKMLIRLNYDFHPNGNLPSEGHSDVDAFIDACVETMRQSRGVWGFILGNETNNPHEFPQGAIISSDYYTRLYNRLWQRKPDGVRLAPQAIDPYFGPGSDSREYWRHITKNISGADFLTIHPKTQDSNPDNCDSNARFSDDPLKWQFLHLRSYEPLLAIVPDRFNNLPVIATEVNPQRHNDMATLGWQEDQGANWVRRSIKHFRTRNQQQARLPIIGIIFYRFSADEWELRPKQSILNAIKAEAAALS
jgi:murein DD-endopeptidase MepM/ murein hydrolase activator NlpD